MTGELMRIWLSRYFLAVAALALLPAVASADVPSGGASYGSSPMASAASCGVGSADRCQPNDELVIKGEDLGSVRTVEFLGGPGPSDNRSARPSRSTMHRLVVRIPSGARSGELEVHTGSSTAQIFGRLLVASSGSDGPAVADVSMAEDVFPIRGAYDIGETETSRFGGPRDHGGQDVFAACGTALVAVRDSTVQRTAYQKRAGNYVVLKDADGQSYVYMHMAGRAVVKRGASVKAGQRVGEVGQTGRATGCHLHFELWAAPGWYVGGKAVDPFGPLNTWGRQAR